MERKLPLMSLQELSKRKLVISLWYQADILTLIAKSKLMPKHGENFLENWQGIVEKKVKSHLSKLSLPKSIQENMFDLITRIGQEIPRWEMFTNSIFDYSDADLAFYIIEQLQWKPDGTVSYGATAEKLVHDKNLDIVNRCQLAYMYRMHDDIDVMRKELPEKYKSEFLGPPLLVIDEQLESFWSCTVKGKEGWIEYDMTY